MIIRHKLIVTTLIVLCTLIIDAVQTENVDCKMIDKEKFKESFNFAYGGGQKGLFLDFTFVNNKSSEFEMGDCKFNLIDGKYFKNNQKKFNHLTKRTMGALTPCTKYRLELGIKNLASKKTFSYENFVTTRPESNMVLELVTAYVSDTSVTFKTVTKVTFADACFIRYQLTVKNALKEVMYNNSRLTTNEISLESLSPSQAYTAQILAFDDKNSTISSKVIDFKTKSHSNCNEINEPDVKIETRNLMSDSVLLKWNLNPAEHNHHLEIIDTTGNSVFSANLSKNSEPINNLKACNEYTARLTIPCATKIASTKFRTLASMPGDVRDVNFNSNHTHSMISWSPPELNVDCIKNYVIKYQKKGKGSNDLTSFTVEKNKSLLVLPRLPYLKKLIVHVYANWNTVKNNQTVLNNSSGKEYEHFDTQMFVVDAISEFRLSPTELQLKWNLDINFGEILNEYQVFYLDKVFTTKQKLINLKIEACKKNYRIVIRCSSQGGNFGPNITYHTSLDDDAVQLSAISVSSFSFKETNNAFLIEWMPTKEEAPCIAKYDITFDGQNFNTNESMKEFHDLSPCITYSIEVAPVTEKGTRGKNTRFDFTTSVIAPKAPLKLEFIKVENRAIELSAALSDNDKNCVLMSSTFITFNCNGEVKSYRIEKSQSNYAVSFGGLHPNAEYNCTASITNEKGSSPHSKTAVITTLQESPQPPKDIKFSVYPNNTVFVKWTPDNTTGFTEYYNIHLKLQRVLYDFGKDCNWSFKNYSTVKALNESFHHLIDLVAYAEYSLNIVSVNDQGSSSFSQAISFTTNPSAPSPVRDISFEVKTNDKSSLSAHLTWKPPCTLNGKFSLYTVSMLGSRKGFGSHNSVEAGQLNEIDLNSLRMGYTYEVEINANVIKANADGNLTGETAIQKFITPSGIPLENDLIEWTNFQNETVDHDRVEIFLKRQIFISSVGDITGISLLIFLNDCPDLPQSSSGYLSHASDSLPASQGVMNCSQLYQQTEILQNPLDHDSEVDSLDLNVYNIKYVLGDGKCPQDSTHQYCNKPLLPGVKYGLFARIFTKDAFRDTQPIYFETRAIESDLINQPMLIIAGSLGALVLISILVSLGCYMSIRRQKKKAKKEKESAETVENLLSFTSYCVIDKTPTPRRHFDHLL